MFKLKHLKQRELLVMLILVNKRMVWISRMFTLIEVINNKWSLSGMC